MERATPTAFDCAPRAIVSGTKVGNSPPQSSSQKQSLYLFPQSFCRVDFRLNLPASVPEAKVMQAQRFQPLCSLLELAGA
jgi:hypothetical protein